MEGLRSRRSIRFIPFIAQILAEWLRYHVNLVFDMKFLPSLIRRLTSEGLAGQAPEIRVACVTPM